MAGDIYARVSLQGGGKVDELILLGSTVQGNGERNWKLKKRVQAAWNVLVNCDGEGVR